MHLVTEMFADKVYEKLKAQFRIAVILSHDSVYL